MIWFERVGIQQYEIDEQISGITMVLFCLNTLLYCVSPDVT